jgi:hypothetical protein
MGSDFRSFLSSFSGGLDPGLDSDLSGFDVTMVVLLFPLFTPDAGPEGAWKVVGRALKKAIGGL